MKETVTILTNEGECIGISEVNQVDGQMLDIERQFYKLKRKGGE